jgi:hypothetical protein
MARYEFGVPGKMLGSRVLRKYTPIPTFSLSDFIRIVAHATEIQYIKPNTITLDYIERLPTFFIPSFIDIFRIGMRTG